MSVCGKVLPYTSFAPLWSVRGNTGPILCAVHYNDRIKAFSQEGPRFAQGACFPQAAGLGGPFSSTL